jgi:hypothetical protein
MVHQVPAYASPTMAATGTAFVRPIVSDYRLKVLMMAARMHRTTGFMSSFNSLNK